MTQERTSNNNFTFPGTSLTVNRVGYGAMQLAGRDGDKLVWGPPRNVDEAIALLREVVASGVNELVGPEMGALVITGSGAVILSVTVRDSVQVPSLTSTE